MIPLLKPGLDQLQNVRTKIYFHILINEFKINNYPFLTKRQFLQDIN